MWWLKDRWDWFWYYRRGKIKFLVWKIGDTYEAMASNGKVTVYNCCGSTPENAKEMALYRINLAMKKEEKKQELMP